jgi:3-dehydroquinate synthase
VIKLKLTIKSSRREYDIYIKDHLLDNIENYLDVSKNYIIISDDNVSKLFVNKLSNKLSNNYLIDFPEGESSKSFFQYERIANILLKKEVKKDSIIIALGGGVTGDLAGFLASTILRGIEYIQIPTTLLSQIDSSIGGKVGINTESAKNCIGSIYPPSLVLIDPKVLDTLPEKHFNNGVAEMIKYGMIKSKSLFEDLKNLDIKSNIGYYIYQSLLIKQELVEKDEFDERDRRLLNFGHTFGHAYEAFYKYEKYLHGEAVGLGMLFMVDKEIESELKVVLSKYNLPSEDTVTKEELLQYVKLDKKAKNNGIYVVMVDKIGEAYIIKKQIEEL